jgi:ataxia telangiectasia mutated family protein
MSYINLANASTDKFPRSNRTKNINFKELNDSHSSQLFPDCIKDMQTIPSVVTVSLPIRADGDYTNDIVKILKFQSTFSITDSGISRPKIIICEGSDGKEYKQLVKGNHLLSTIAYHLVCLLYYHESNAKTLITRHVFWCL